MSSPSSWLYSVEPLRDGALAWSLIGAEGQPLSGLVDAGVTAPVPEARSSVLGLLAAAPLTDVGREHQLVAALGKALIPGSLRTILTDGGEHTVALAVRGWPAMAPWDALAVDGDLRLIECARVVGSFPSTVTQTRRALRPDNYATNCLRLIDVGPLADPNYRPLYPGAVPENWYAATVGESETLTADDAIDLATFAARLASRDDWSRLLYFGHVREGVPDAPASAALVLGGARDPQFLTAFDWLAEPERWPAPERVGFIGCSSNDSQLIEQSGLALAAFAAGAQLVTVTRWTLPSDGALGSGCTGTTDLALAVDAAHAGDRPIDDLRDWQLGRLDHWRARGEVDASPLLWASLVTYVGNDS